MRRLVLVAGAQDLARDPRAVAWYDRALQLLVLELSRIEGAILVTAGSPGPEVHAEMLAFTFGVTAVARSSSLTRTRLAEAAGIPMRLRLWEPPGVALAEAAE